MLWKLHTHACTAVSQRQFCKFKSLTLIVLLEFIYYSSIDVHTGFAYQSSNKKHCDIIVMSYYFKQFTVQSQYCNFILRSKES